MILKIFLKTFRKWGLDWLSRVIGEALSRLQLNCPIWKPARAPWQGGLCTRLLPPLLRTSRAGELLFAIAFDEWNLFSILVGMITSFRRNHSARYSFYCWGSSISSVDNGHFILLSPVYILRNSCHYWLYTSAGHLYAYSLHCIEPSDSKYC